MTDPIEGKKNPANVFRMADEFDGSDPTDGWMDRWVDGWIDDDEVPFNEIRFTRGAHSIVSFFFAIGPMQTYI